MTSLILLALGAAVGVFFLAQKAGYGVVNRVYLSDEATAQRVSQTLGEFQSYVKLNNLTSTDFSQIAGWTMRFYTKNVRSGEIAITKLTYIPAAGFTGRATIAYTATTSLGKTLTGTITMKFITDPRNIDKMNKKVPVYFFSGAEDPVGEKGKGVERAYKAFLKAGMEDVFMRLYPGGRHEAPQAARRHHRRRIFSFSHCSTPPRSVNTSSNVTFLHRKSQLLHSAKIDKAPRAVLRYFSHRRV